MLAGSLRRRFAGRGLLGSKSFLLRIDLPRAKEIGGPFCMIDGWFGWQPGTETPRLRVNGLEPFWKMVDRPDVRKAFPGKSSQGFRIFLDASLFWKQIAQSAKRLRLELTAKGETVAARDFQVSKDALPEIQAADERRRTKRQWLKEQLACPFCLAGALEFCFGAIECRNCKRRFLDSGSVFDFLPEDFRLQFHIEDVDDISEHPYDEVATEIVEQVRQKGVKVLDCGAGMRPRIDDAVICLDVAPFPTVDVLAVNQKLPFRSAVFDAVLSLNVLEHVTDPFACAAELVRVLKPGGTLYCCIPFLQPEHGYPHHYFNATRSGLRQLFPVDFETIQHVVPRSGEPVWSLRWFLSWYAEQLPSDEREKFLNLRLGDVLKRPAELLLEESWVSGLSAEGKWKLASTTAAVFRKPASRENREA